MKIIGVVGSLRKDSYNRKLLHFVKETMGNSAELIDWDYSDVPLFNQDYEFPTPPAVAELRQAIKDADGVFFFVPEYNQGIPGVLKNVVDWISRPVSFETMEKVLVDKPVGIMGATMGVSGTITAQEDLRSYLSFMNVPVMPQPRATISAVHTAVDENGNLNLDPVTEGFVVQTAKAFIDFVKRVN